jgi:phosphoribosylformylglycinamidine cyclo-ligase
MSTHHRATLAAAGVSRAAAARLLEEVGPCLDSTDPDGRVLRLPGFSAAIEVGEGLVLAATVDGVGSKRTLMRDCPAELGRDLVAYNVNDLAAVGVRPLAFLDYLSADRLDVDFARQLLEGMAAACREAGCVLLGGETAEHPGIQGPGEVDVAGFAVGLARRDELVDGMRCRAGDAIVAIASAGPHASGFSLIRHAFARVGRPVPAGFLAPTPVLSPVIEAATRAAPVTALAHICDGGLTENLTRGMPEWLGAAIRLRSWPCPSWVEELLAVGCREDDLRSTVNVGVAFALAVSPGHEGSVLGVAAAAGHAAWTIGEVVRWEGGPRVAYQE